MKTSLNTEIPLRILGHTGQKVSAIGLGGSHIGARMTEAESIQIIRYAIDNGITFMDNCWDYNEGASEIRMGKALKDGYRNKVFLMTKYRRPYRRKRRLSSSRNRCKGCKPRTLTCCNSMKSSA